MRSLYSPFEWYYFDLHSSDGYDLIVTLHTRPFQSAFDITIVDIVLYKNNARVFQYFFPLAARLLSEQNDPLQIKLSEYVNLTFQGNILQVFIQNEHVALTLSLVSLYPNYERKKYQLMDRPEAFEWIVFIPKGEATANLKWDGDEYQLSGYGYFDSNSGTVNLKNELSYWFWGKYYFGNSMLIYGNIITRNGESKKVSLFIDGEHLYINNNLDLKIDGNIIASSEFVLEIDQKRKIDEIQFYMAKHLKISPIVKILEALSQLLKKKPILTHVTNLINNTKYQRFRANGTKNNEMPVTCFYEEMFL